MADNDKFLQLDEDGFFVSEEKRLFEKSLCGPALLEIRSTDAKTFVTNFNGIQVIVEAFDEPYVAQHVSVERDQWKIELPYDVELNFNLASLTLDEWDRFHGYAENKVPFVFSRNAQSEFFNLLSEYDDDSVSWNGQKYEVQPYWANQDQLNKENYWSDVYVKEVNPGWNLAGPAEALKDMLPRLKLPRSRVLVLGCGEGHDAALFAKEGHLVTAVDISKEAILRAKKNYPEVGHLEFFESDLFHLPSTWKNSFDLVFEHTCYCAINPTRRAELVRLWSQMLLPKGQLMGVFFTMEKRQGPPFGGTEWELRERLKKNFDFLFWGRWRKSIERRQGRELFVLAQKKSLL